MTDEIEEIEIVFVGDLSVGKSSITKRFLQNSFDENIAPSSSLLYFDKVVKFSNESIINIKNIELCGDEKYRNFLDTLMKNPSAVAIVYSLDKSYFTFDELKQNWLDKINEKAPQNTIKALVLNKNDLLGTKEFSEKEGKDFADKNGLLFFSVSAKENIGITELYEGLIRKIKGWDNDVKLIVENEEEKNEEEKKEEENIVEEKKEEENIVELGKKEETGKKSNIKERKKKCKCF